MRVVAVDPRDVTWEIEPVGYRVYSWSRPGRGEEHLMWTAGEHEITGALVVEVIGWAQQELAARRTARPDHEHRVTIGALLDDPVDGRGLVVLNGDEPTAGGTAGVTFGWGPPA